MSLKHWLWIINDLETDYPDAYRVLEAEPQKTFSFLKAKGVISTEISKRELITHPDEADGLKQTEEFKKEILKTGINKYSITTNDNFGWDLTCVNTIKFTETENALKVDLQRYQQFDGACKKHKQAVIDLIAKYKNKAVTWD